MPLVGTKERHAIFTIGGPLTILSINLLSKINKVLSNEGAIALFFLLVFRFGTWGINTGSRAFLGKCQWKLPEPASSSVDFLGEVNPIFFFFAFFRSEALFRRDGICRTSGKFTDTSLRFQPYLTLVFRNYKISSNDNHKPSQRWICLPSALFFFCSSRSPQSIRDFHRIFFVNNNTLILLFKSSSSRFSLSLFFLFSFFFFFFLLSLHQQHHKQDRLCKRVASPPVSAMQYNAGKNARRRKKKAKNREEIRPRQEKKKRLW